MSVTISGSGQIVKQVQTTSATNAFSTTSNTMANITGMSVNITPTNSSNKVLISVSVVQCQSTAGYNIAFQLTRNGTPVGIGTLGTTAPNYSFVYVSGSPQPLSTINYSFIDSPATTSAVTYQLQIRIQSGGGTWYMNNYPPNLNGGTDTYNAGYASQITAQELAYA